MHAIDNNGTDIGYVLDVNTPLVKVWMPVKSEAHQVSMTTGWDQTAGNEPSIVKIYFSTDDCSGTPYTYSPLTQPNTNYKTNYSGAGPYLRTTTTQVNLFIPTVVHAGETTCSSENASYDLYQANWTPSPTPDYAPPITIVAR